MRAQLRIALPFLIGLVIGALGLGLYLTGEWMIAVDNARYVATATP